MTASENCRSDDIDVRIENTDWPNCVDQASLAVVVGKAVAAALCRSGPQAKVEVSVLLTDAGAVRVLNRDYRGRDAATNVLAFAVQQDDRGDLAPHPVPVQLGDIVIAGSVCRDEAVAQGKTLAAHISHLAVHGTLHLLGYDHEGDSEAETMETLERDILASLGMPDPYEDIATA